MYTLLKESFTLSSEIRSRRVEKKSRNWGVKGWWNVFIWEGLLVNLGAISVRFFLFVLKKGLLILFKRSHVNLIELR